MLSFYYGYINVFNFQSYLFCVWYRLFSISSTLLLYPSTHFPVTCIHFSNTPIHFIFTSIHSRNTHKHFLYTSIHLVCMRVHFCNTPIYFLITDIHFHNMCVHFRYTGIHLVFTGIHFYNTSAYFCNMHKYSCDTGVHLVCVCVYFFDTFGFFLDIYSFILFSLTIDAKMRFNYSLSLRDCLFLTIVRETAIAKFVVPPRSDGTVLQTSVIANLLR